MLNCTCVPVAFGGVHCRRCGQVFVFAPFGRDDLSFGFDAKAGHVFLRGPSGIEIASSALEWLQLCLVSGDMAQPSRDQHGNPLGERPALLRGQLPKSAGSLP